MSAPDNIPEDYSWTISDRYVIMDRIGSGGMAEIFRAKMFGAAGFEKEFAIKLIRPHLLDDEEFVEMFVNEAKLTVALYHTNIVQVFDFGLYNDRYYIVMEYVEGKDLLDILARCVNNNIRIPLDIGLHIVMELLKGLDFAHRATDVTTGEPLNIIHRDISPSNILVSYIGGVKIGDFGVAKAKLKQSMSRTGTLKGKVGYMSPEQVVGDPIDSRSDIFAAGIILYEIISMTRLFRAENDFATMIMVRDCDIDSALQRTRKLPSQLERIVRKALARSADQRYQTAGDFCQDLSTFCYEHGLIIDNSKVSNLMRRLFAADIERQKQKRFEENQTLRALRAKTTSLKVLQSDASKDENFPDIPTHSSNLEQPFYSPSSSESVSQSEVHEPPVHPVVSLISDNSSKVDGEDDSPTIPPNLGNLPPDPLSRLTARSPSSPELLPNSKKSPFISGTDPLSRRKSRPKIQPPNFNLGSSPSSASPHRASAAASASDHDFEENNEKISGVESHPEMINEDEQKVAGHDFDNSSDEHEEEHTELVDVSKADKKFTSHAPTSEQLFHPYEEASNDPISAANDTVAEPNDLVDFDDETKLKDSKMLFPDLRATRPPKRVVRQSKSVSPPPPPISNSNIESPSRDDLQDLIESYQNKSFYYRGSDQRVVGPLNGNQLFYYLTTNRDGDVSFDNVSWTSIQKFIEKLGAKRSKKPLPPPSREERPTQKRQPKKDMRTTKPVAPPSVAPPPVAPPPPPVRPRQSSSLPRTGEDAFQKIMAAASQLEKLSSINSTADVERNSRKLSLAEVQPSRVNSMLNLQNDITDKGSFDNISFTRLLYSVFAGKRTGRLVLYSGSTSKEFFFENGRAVSVMTNLDHKRLGDFLIEHGQITKEQLAANNVIPAHETVDYLRRQFEENLLEVFDWTSGTYEFFQNEMTSERNHTLNVDLLRIIAEGCQHRIPIDLIHDYYQSRDKSPIRLDSAFENSLDRFKFGPRAIRVLRSFHSGDSLTSIRNRLSSDKIELAERGFYLMHQVGLILFENSNRHAFPSGSYLDTDVEEPR